ncbi:hypothetical protein SHN02_05685 [Lacticaseibacillus paracasei]|nr:hypothetical protein SHN02_05685 [Lacticaseibacillus paracasei]
MLEPDWNTAALNEYQNRLARQEEEPPLDWQGHPLVDGETYLEYHDELVNEYDVIDFLMSLGATEYDY